jgi:predicted nucleic acid-binding protein
MIVIDASAMVELVIGTPRISSFAKRLASDLAEDLHAPQIIDLEVASMLRKQVQRRTLSPSAASALLAEFTRQDIVRYEHRDLLARVWQLRGNLTPYDAAYVALAEGLDAPLITCDRKLANAPGHRARIELVP